jgi:DNA-directed RNA polymerase subunit H (RpoH/RPB5)
MLTDQQMDISNLHHIDRVELEALSKKNENIFSIDVNKNTKIIYYMNSKFKIQDLRKFLQTFSAPSDDQNHTLTSVGSDKLQNLIIVFKEKINNFNAKNVDDFNELDLQVFLLKELMFNVSKHVLVPKHIVISDQEEIAQIVRQFNLRNKLQFPIILKTDPMARYLNLKNGQMVKIIRTSPTAGISEYYRCCV